MKLRQSEIAFLMQDHKPRIDSLPAKRDAALSFAY